jgi:hypothetical protein
MQLLRYFFALSLLRGRSRHDPGPAHGGSRGARHAARRRCTAESWVLRRFVGQPCRGPAGRPWPHLVEAARPADDPAAPARHAEGSFLGRSRAGRRARDPHAPRAKAGPTPGPGPYGKSRHSGRNRAIRSSTGLRDTDSRRGSPECFARRSRKSIMHAAIAVPNDACLHQCPREAFHISRRSGGFQHHVVPALDPFTGAGVMMGLSRNFPLQPVKSRGMTVPTMRRDQDGARQRPRTPLRQASYRPRCIARDIRGRA